MIDHDAEFEKLKTQLAESYEKDSGFRALADRAAAVIETWRLGGPCLEPTEEELRAWDEAGAEWDRAVDEAVEKKRRGLL